VVFEMLRIGNSVRVAALDLGTNTEVVLVGSAHMISYSLKITATHKLR
jgi:hypothetical protein